MSDLKNELERVHVPNKNKLPLYGPLNISDNEEYLQEEERKFFANYWSQFPYQLSLENFELLYQLGTGAFGVVFLVKYKLFGSLYAMKVLNKKELVMKNQVKKAQNEKMMLQSLNCPFTIYMLYFSQDNSNIYFVLPFLTGGELYTTLLQFGKFNDNLAKFYTAQVVLALEYLHRCSVVYRDLKPENILLDSLGYLKIVDFGLSKLVHQRTYTFCGTPDYLAPETVLSRGYGKAVDWWALGVLIFEMCSGQPPFAAADVHAIFENIAAVKYTMPNDFEEDLKDLVGNLLQRDVTKRYGNLKEGVGDIKNHTWFKQINWLALLNRRVIPPYVPVGASYISRVSFPDIKRVTRIEIADEDEFENVFDDF